MLRIGFQWRALVNTLTNNSKRLKRDSDPRIGSLFELLLRRKWKVGMYSAGAGLHGHRQTDRQTGFLTPLQLVPCCRDPDFPWVFSVLRNSGIVPSKSVPTRRSTTILAQEGSVCRGTCWQHLEPQSTQSTCAFHVRSSINKLGFVMGTPCVFCEVRTKFVTII